MSCFETWLLPTNQRMKARNPTAYYQRDASSRFQRSTFCFLFATVVAIFPNALPCSAQIPASIKRLAPDPMHLDSASEAILARFESPNTSADFSKVDQLNKLLDAKDLSLVLIDQSSSNRSFAFKTFANAKYIATQKRFHIQGMDNAVINRALGGPDSDVGNLAAEYPLSQNALLDFGSKDFANALAEIDTAIELGWTHRARILLSLIEPSFVLRREGNKNALAVRPNELSWFEADKHFTRYADGDNSNPKQLIELLAQNIDESIPPNSLRKRWLAQLWCRYLFCSYLDQDIERFRIESNLVVKTFDDEIFGFNKVEDATSLNPNALQVKRLVELWQEQLDDLILRTNSQKFPLKSKPLHEYDHILWESMFDEPKFALNALLVPGFPAPPTAVLSRGRLDKLFLRHEGKIYGWDQSTQTGWPGSRGNGRGFASAYGNLPLALAEQLELGAVASNSHAVYSLIDSGSRSSASSSTLLSSWLVGLDLEREASLIGASPIAFESLLNRYPADQVLGSGNFVGTPLCLDDRIYVLAASTTSNEQFQVVCFDAETLVPRWLSPKFGVDRAGGGIPALSLPCMLQQQGMLYVLTARGCLATIDEASGELINQLHYVEEITQEYRSPITVRRKSVLLPFRDLILCCPSDSEAIFAFARKDGIVRWVLESQEIKRSSQVVGVVDNKVICLGDRITWIDPETGVMERVLELPFSDRLANGMYQLEQSELSWSNGRTICRLDLSSKDVDEMPYRLTPEQIARAKMVFDEAFAFRIVDGFLAVVTPSRWRVFQ